MGKDWAHDGATPLEDVDVNASYTGTVTNVGQFGVFVDFGAVKDGLLKVPSKLGRRLKKGMQIEDLTITSLDADAGKVVMEVDESQLQDLEPRPRSRGRSPKPKARAKSRPRSRPRRTWDHQGATPLEELNPGDTFEGTVTNVSVYGVFVDLGAVRDARLNVPAVIGRKFRIGDVVQDCTIENIDLEQQRMSVTLPDPEAAVRDLPPKEPAAKAKAKAAPKPKAKAKTKAKAKAASQSSRRKTEASGGMELDELNEGDVFEGTVTNVGRYGVFVDVGAVKDARLSVPTSIGKTYKRGDYIQECIIDKLDLDKGQMSVSLPEELPRAKAAPKASAKGKAKAQVKAKAKATSQMSTQRARSPSEPPSRSTSAKAKPRASSVPRTAGGTATSPARAQPKRAASAGPTRGGGGGGGGGGASRPPAREKPAPRAPATTTPKGIAIEKLHVGKAVDGIVTNNNQYGVFVNIGCAKDARLNVSRVMAKEFRKGDEIYGMTIESVDLDKNQISCSLEDPELFVEEETAPPSRRKK